MNFQFFASEISERFKRSPAAVAEYIDSNFACLDNYDYDGITSDPRGLLQMKCGSDRSLRILFVAICRSFGIPARLNEITRLPEYFFKNMWNDARPSAAPEMCTLTITSETGSNLKPAEDYSIAKLENGMFKTLGSDSSWNDGKYSLSLSPGFYRILTANRQIDGSILAKAYHFSLSPSQNAEIKIGLRKSQMKSRLKNMPLSEHTLLDFNGEKHLLSDIVSGCHSCVIAVIKVGAEPTEHLLNEICGLKEAYSRNNVILIVDGSDALKDPTLSRTMKQVPSLKLYFSRETNFPDSFFDELQLGDHRLPLSAVLDGSKNAKFAFSNYNVGTAQLLLQIADSL